MISKRFPLPRVLFAGRNTVDGSLPARIRIAEQELDRSLLSVNYRKRHCHQFALVNP